MDRKRVALERVRQRVLERDVGSHPRLKAMLAEEYKKVAAEVEQLRVRLAREVVEPDPFTEKRWEDLKRWSADVRRIWQATTTTDQDRKQLIRMLIKKVVVEKVEPERVELHILWADGRPCKVIELFRSPYFHRLMLEWHIEGLSPQVMVERLAAIGAHTQQGNPWSLDTVKKTLAILVKRARLSGKGEGLPARSEPHDCGASGRLTRSSSRRAMGRRGLALHTGTRTAPRARHRLAGPSDHSRLPRFPSTPLAPMSG